MAPKNPSALVAHPSCWKWESDDNSVTIENIRDGGVWIGIKITNNELLPQMLALITRTLKENS